MLDWSHFLWMAFLAFAISMVIALMRGDSFLLVGPA
jgi:ATP/ADP translocase